METAWLDASGTARCRSLRVFQWPGLAPCGGKYLCCPTLGGASRGVQRVRWPARFAQGIGLCSVHYADRTRNCTPFDTSVRAADEANRFKGRPHPFRLHQPRWQRCGPCCHCCCREHPFATGPQRPHTPSTRGVPPRVPGGCYPLHHRYHTFPTGPQPPSRPWTYPFPTFGLGGRGRALFFDTRWAPFFLRRVYPFEQVG